MDVFDLLNQIKQRPGLYVGGSDDQRREQLRNLELLLHGYSLALGNHQVQEPVSDLPREFAKYLRDRFGWSASCGPVAAVCDATQGESDAWDLFWRLIEEFRLSLTQSQ